jgi:hypothetical protein
MTHWKKRIRDERGATLVLVAASMVALLGFAALAVDVGNLLLARTEAQAAADAGALAGAGWLAVYPEDAANAKAEAIKFAGPNRVSGDSVAVLDTDVDVNLDSATVTVRVIRSAARGTSIPTFFAGILGVNDVDIGATATAWAQPVGGDENVEEQCFLPIAMPDRWWEDEGTLTRATYDDTWDPDLEAKKVTDDVADSYGSPFDPDATNVSGYTDDDKGTPVYIRSATGGGGDMSPGWYFPWTPFGEESRINGDDPGGAEYRSRFTGCMNGSYGITDSVYTEPGAMIGPTDQGFGDLIALDPNVSFNQVKGCVVNSSGSCVSASPRIKPVPLFDPTLPPDAGRKSFTISNIGYIFVEGETTLPKLGKVWVGRWLGGTLSPGDGSPGPGGPTEEPLPRRLRLIR